MGIGVLSVNMFKESDVSKQCGLTRNELKKIREAVPSVHPELGLLWEREKSKKPEKMRTVLWTDGGILFLANYIKIRNAWVEEEQKQPEMKSMTKGEFDKAVNNTKWVGKVVNNNYKNNTCLMVEHDTGFKVIVLCRDSRTYPKLGYVIVDSKNLRHTVRLPYFKTHEKAHQEASKSKA